MGKEEILSLYPSFTNLFESEKNKIMSKRTMQGKDDANIKNVST